MRERDPAARAARFAALTPLVVGAVVLAVHVGAAPTAASAVAGPGQPAVIAPALLARLLPIADIAGREQLVAALLVALAAALVAHLVASARGDRGAALGGAVAGLWLAMAPSGWALAAGLGPEVVGLAAAAALLVAHDRLARGGGPPTAALLGVAAALALLADGRSAMAVTVAAALLTYRARRGARWIALAPVHGAVVALALIAAAALTGGLRWPPAPIIGGLEPWLDAMVDDLGPVALVTGGLGVGLALRARGDRWLAGALVAGLLAAMPPARPMAPIALVALAIGVGHAVAAAARAAERLLVDGMGGVGGPVGLAARPSVAPGPAAGPWAVAIALAAVILVPPLWSRVDALRSAGDRDRARVSSYAAAPWKSSPATGR